MSSRSLESFTRRVRLSLLLVIAYLLLLQGLHSLGAWRAHERLRGEAEARARLAGMSIVRQQQDALRESLRNWQRGASPRRLPMPRSSVADQGIVSVELLTPAGWGMDARVGEAARPHASRVTEAQRRRLEAGEVLVDLSSTSGDPDYAVAVALQPVLDSDARLVGIVEVGVGASDVAVSRRELFWGMAIEGISLLAFCLLLAQFMRWTLRPLRLLATTTGREPTDAEARALSASDETGFVIDTYRRMIEQLREKELELRRLREVERHRADALQELNASIVDSMVSGVIVLDLSGSIRSMYEIARSILHVTEERTIGRPYAEALRSVPEIHGRLQACLDEGAVIGREEIRLNLPSIGRRDVGLALSPLKDAEGHRTGALFVLVDLTEVKRLQDEVRLKQSLAELGELSAGIAHEFRNSLATILGFAQLVERHGKGDAREHAKAIENECVALRRVVDDFLRFANPTRLVVEAVDLQALFAELAEDVAMRAAGKRVRYDVDAGLPVISGDETLLRRAFTNLVRNAVDAVAEDGHVRVGAELAPGEVTVHVDDDGPGIPAEAREQVFVPFFTRKEHGTGLGLALARKVVVHHGGRIAVEVSPLGGARVSVTLPMRPVV